MSPRGEEGAPSAPILAISLTSLNGWATVLGTSIAEPAAAEKGRRSLAWLSRGLPGRRALLPSELPDGHQRGEGGHRLPRPRAMAPSSRQNCLWPARQRAGHAGEAGPEEKEMQSGKPRACLGRGRPWKERALSVPQATGGLLGRQSSELPGYRKCGAISCWAMATPSVLPQGPLGGPSWDLRPFLPWQSPCPREGSVALLQEASLD